MLRPNENKNAPQGNVAQGRGGVVGRKTGGRWSELPISDEELVRRYQAGAGVKAIAKQLGTNHVKILRRIRQRAALLRGGCHATKGKRFQEGVRIKRNSYENQENGVREAPFFVRDSFFGTLTKP